MPLSVNLNLPPAEPSNPGTLFGLTVFCQPLTADRREKFLRGLRVPEYSEIYFYHLLLTTISIKQNRKYDIF